VSRSIGASPPALFVNSSRACAQGVAPVLALALPFGLGAAAQRDVRGSTALARVLSSSVEAPVKSSRSVDAPDCLISEQSLARVGNAAEFIDEF
jgi:hypothetical protein